MTEPGQRRGASAPRVAPRLGSCYEHIGRIGHTLRGAASHSSAPTQGSHCTRWMPAALVSGEPASCFASFWTVDWSRWGAGNALLVATLQGWRSYGSNEFFAASLAGGTGPPFPRGCPVPAGRDHPHPGRVRRRAGPRRGFRATGRKATLEISGVLDRRHFAAPDFQLGDCSASLSNVYLPCGTGRLWSSGWNGLAPAALPRTAGTGVVGLRRRRRILGTLAARGTWGGTARGGAGGLVLTPDDSAPFRFTERRRWPSEPTRQ